MSIATLLNVPADSAGQNAFAFEHAMAHRGVMAVMAPLNQWSAMPYFITPADWKARPANNWNLNHQQAHNDYASFLPAYPSDTQPNIPSFMDQNILVDTNMADPVSKTWWTFINHRDHFVANELILPLPFALVTVPWWAVTGRRALNFW